MSGEHAVRKRLPDTRTGTRYHVVIYSEEGDLDVYILVNHYEDTREPAEIFVNVSKQGSSLQGMLDGWAIMASMALQYGVPLQNIIDKFAGQAFPPYGPTSFPGIQSCTSLLDLVVRVLDADAAAKKRG